MPRILVTGMSGTGKSTALAELERRGFRLLDADGSDWSSWDPDGDDGAGEWLWREDRLTELLADPPEDVLYVSGCASNQGRFYDRVEAVVLLSAPVEVVLARIGSRTTNDFGKRPGERERIVSDLERFESLLRATCTHEIDATSPPAEVVESLVAIGEAAR